MHKHLKVIGCRACCKRVLLLGDVPIRAPPVLVILSDNRAGGIYATNDKRYPAPYRVVYYRCFARGMIFRDMMMHGTRYWADLAAAAVAG